jgi:hypothetical protein
MIAAREVVEQLRVLRKDFVIRSEIGTGVSARRTDAAH